MALTGIRSDNIRDEEIKRQDLCVTGSTESVIAKIVAGSGCSQTYTGADSGTGDVTVIIDPIVIPFIMTGLNNGWYAIPTGVTEFFETINSRTKFDLTYRTQARLVIGINSGDINLKIRVQYSTNQADWYYLDGDAGPSCDTC